MPCDSSHMEAHSDEVLARETAKVLQWALTTTGRKVPKDIAHAAKDYYGQPYVRPGVSVGVPEDWPDEIVRRTCEFFRALSVKERDALLYGSPRDKAARTAADWWEEHEKADRAREAEQQRATKREKLAEVAAAKLTPAELKALTRKVRGY
jgi:hypothetical protein